MTAVDSPVHPVARTVVRCGASAATVHGLLLDTSAWFVWSPHVATVDAEQRWLHEGWRGRVRAFFAPLATTMQVTWTAPDGGADWESTLGPWRLAYRNRVTATPHGSLLDWSAALEGPAAELLARLVGPLSAYGQRRRLERLARTAEVVEAHATGGGTTRTGTSETPPRGPVR